jgi:hypothetical protein
MSVWVWLGGRPIPFPLNPRHYTSKEQMIGYSVPEVRMWSLKMTAIYLLRLLTQQDVATQVWRISCDMQSKYSSLSFPKWLCLCATLFRAVPLLKGLDDGLTLRRYGFRCRVFGVISGGTGILVGFSWRLLFSFVSYHSVSVPYSGWYNKPQ